MLLSPLNTGCPFDKDPSRIILRTAWVARRIISLLELVIL